MFPPYLPPPDYSEMTKAQKSLLVTIHAVGVIGILVFMIIFILIFGLPPQQ